MISLLSCWTMTAKFSDGLQRKVIPERHVSSARYRRAAPGRTLTRRTRVCLFRKVEVRPVSTRGVRSAGCGARHVTATCEGRGGGARPRECPLMTRGACATLTQRSAPGTGEGDVGGDVLDSRHHVHYALCYSVLCSAAPPSDWSTCHIVACWRLYMCFDG